MSTLYTAGTIDFTNGSNVIVGHGTGFIGLLAGDLLLAPDGYFYEFASDPTSDTIATLTTLYNGSTASGFLYGSGWAIIKASVSRDSVRTATRQLTEITNLYRQIVNLTASDQTLRLSKATTGDRAGVVMQKAGIDLMQAGTFQDDDFAIRYLIASTWTKAIGIGSTDGALSIYSKLILGNTITPIAITALTDNYAPNGIDKATLVRVSSNGDWTITGLAAGQDGRVLALLNVGSNPLELESQSGRSADANRFAFTSNVTLAPNGSVLLTYDGTSSRWRQLAGSGSGTGGVGYKGWSPLLAYVSNGTGGVVAQISDWSGGEGAKPAIGSYIGPTGLVATAAEGVSVLGPKGDQIQFRLELIRRYVQWSYVGTIDWQDLISFDQITGPPTALEWTFATGTADADPGAGGLSFDSATFGSVGHLYISKSYRTGTDASAFINTFDDSSSLPNRGTLVLIDTLDQTKVATLQVTDAVVDAGTYIKIPVTPIGGVVFSNTRRISVLFLRTGDKGIPGIIPRGPYNSATSYIVGDVADVDGSSYISLVQPNLGNAVNPNGNNAFWALFARGVNQAFVDAINLTLTNSTTQATNSAASATLAQNYAVKVNGFVVNTDNSAMAWAIGGTGAGQPAAGDARSWAISVNGMVDGTSFSAKEYAQGIQGSTGGSAKNWAQKTGADVPGAALNSRSAKSWAQEALIGSTLGGSAKDWATYTAGTVDGTFYSAKYYADSVIAARSDVLTLEALVNSEATASASNASSANSSATTATTQAGIATTKAGEAASSAATATTQAGVATTAKNDAVTAKSDAQTAATGTSADKATTLSYRNDAQAAAVAAQNAATALANPDYGFFVDAPADNRDYGSFV